MFSNRVSSAAEADAPVPALQVMGLRWNVNPQFQVRDVDFSLERGRGLAVVGANGAGKSSLLRLLSGLTKPDAGSIRLCGIAGDDWRKTAQHVGFVQQRKELPDHFTVREYVMQQIQMRRASAGICGELLDMAGLSAHAGARATNLSGGNQRKLQILCALVHKPAVLIVDEPSNGLDAQFHDEVTAYLDRLKREMGLCLVLTTHRLDEVLLLADWIAVMSEGRFARLGPKEAILAGLERASALTLNFPPGAEAEAACAQAAELLRSLPQIEQVERSGSDIEIRPRDAAPELLAAVVQHLAQRNLHLRGIAWARPGLKELIQSKD